MPVFRIMLEGLDAKDTSSLKSMLGLSADLLNNEWVIVEEGDADLSIYSFDTDKGKEAWQQHGNRISAVLTTGGNITETVDIVLKKPLRTSNFSNALNLVADMLTHTEAESAIDNHKHQEKTDTDSTDKVSFLASLTSFWRGKKSLPTDGLVATSPLAFEETDTDTITKPDLLEAWMSQLPQDPLQRNVTVLSYLRALNLKKLSASRRLVLLELYFSNTKQLFFKRDIETIKLEQAQTKDTFKAIRVFRGVLEELMLGYKLVIDELSGKSKTLNEQSPLVFAINRATEITGLHMLHGFQHYHPVPKGDLGQLHQFYLFLEENQQLHTVVLTKQNMQAPCFFELYAQILLTGVADPYGLNRFEILRLFNLMHKFTDKVEIGLINPKHINLTSDFLLSGHFCLDCAQDTLPKAMSKAPVSIRSAESSRLLNIQPLLLSLESLFKKVTKPSKVGLDLDLQILEKITPKLNTTYERKYHRLPSVRNRSMHLARGLKLAHNAVNGNHQALVEWAIVNQGSEGMMISRPSDGSHLLDIHDLVAVFEKDLPVKLAVVRWLMVDMDDLTQAGLELLTTQSVKPVSVMPQGQPEDWPALIIDSNDPQQPSIMLCEKGLFSPKRILRVKGNAEPYTVVAGHVIDATLDYEQFNYSHKSGS